MVAITTLQYLSSQKLKDATALLKMGRNSGAVYLMGYALEFSLKRKISLTLGFANGFPDKPNDFTGYLGIISTFNILNTGIQLTGLKEIRNHNLDKLLTFSGVEAKIKSFFFDEWQVITNWNPEDRYKIKRYTKLNAKKFLNSAKTILEQIA